MNEESKNSDDDFEHAFDAYEREDYKTAYKLFLSLANKGDADAQFSVGDMLEDGLGVKQNYKKAIKWYRLAVKQGHGTAQSALGFMYCHGRGVEQDYKQAIK